MSRRWLLLAVLIGAACRDATGSRTCPAFSSYYVVTPRDTTLTAGSTARASVTQVFNSCVTSAPPQLVDTRWRSSDSTIVRVDSLSGLLTALRPGAATVTATWTGLATFPIHLTVQ